MTLWLARHAEVLAAPGLCYGRTDLPPEPVATESCARRLAAALPIGLPVHSSPLLRCRLLAERLLALRPDLQWAIDARLAEMDFGRWEGRPWAAISRAEIDAWTEDFEDHRPGHGESVADFLARVREAYAEARAKGRDTVWITHAGVIRAVSLLAAGVPVPLRSADWPREAVPLGEWKRLEIAPT